jgi:CrcB protein
VHLSFNSGQDHDTHSSASLLLCQAVIRIRSAKSARRRPATMLKSLLVIAVGASLGAWLRWLLGIKLNALFPTIPPGTVAANMVGGYIIGFAIAFLAASPSLSPEWRLLVITGFCGGLTTFSTFSAETVALIQEGRLLWALGSVSLHVVGSLVMTAAGLLTYQMIGMR